MIVYSHPDCLLKFNGQGHPERKERLDSILKSIKTSDLKVEFKEAPKVDLEIVSLVHPKKHIEQIFANIQKEDTFVDMQKRVATEEYNHRSQCGRNHSVRLNRNQKLTNSLIPVSVHDSNCFRE